MLIQPVNYLLGGILSAAHQERLLQILGQLLIQALGIDNANPLRKWTGRCPKNFFLKLKNCWLIEFLTLSDTATFLSKQASGNVEGYPVLHHFEESPCRFSRADLLAQPLMLICLNVYQ